MINHRLLITFKYMQTICVCLICVLCSNPCFIIKNFILRNLQTSFVNKGLHLSDTFFKMDTQGFHREETEAMEKTYTGT